MIRIGAAVAVGLALVVAACATGYGPRGLGGGYSDDMLDASHHRVKFNGNGYASSERVWTFWIYRCAELTKEKGYTHFTLLRPGQSFSERREASPLQKAVYRSGSSGGLIQTKGGGGGYVYVPSYSYSTVTTWSADAVVSMHRNPLPEYVVVLSADTILEQLAPYVKSDGKGTPVKREQLFQRAATMNRPPANYNFGGTL